MDEHPKLVDLPAEKKPYCLVVVDKLGKRYEAHAYGPIAEDCSRIRKGSKVKLLCELDMEETPMPQGRPKRVLSLRVRGVRVHAPPRERMS